MKKNPKYNYVGGTVSTDHGSRNYEVAGFKLPSVTTILARTKDQSYIKRWKEKVGDEEAERIKNLSSKRGTSMHKFIEKHIRNIGYEDLTEIGVQAKPMAQKIIEIGFTPITEYYGSEVTLYYPGLYAGSTDLVCMHNDKETVVDFKQANRPKREEWIEDYFLQLGAYSLAHNAVYNSRIAQGVVLICTADNLFQDFKIKGDQLTKYQNRFLEKVEQFYRQLETN